MVVVLSIAGDQLPTIPSLDVVGNGFRILPEQIGAIAVNVGVTEDWFTTIVIVVDDAHSPVDGVNV